MGYIGFSAVSHKSFKEQQLSADYIGHKSAANQAAKSRKLKKANSVQGMKGNPLYRVKKDLFLIF